MVTINKITITQVSISHVDGGYDIEGGWDVQKSAGSYTGSYLMQVVFNGNVVQEKEIKNEFGDTDTFGTITTKDLDLTQDYYLVVSTDKNCKVSDKQLLYFYSFDNVKATYDGQTIDVTWNKLKGRAKMGRCTLRSKENTVVDYTITPNSRHISESISFKDYDANNVWSLILVPSLNPVVDGPPSQAIEVYTQNPTIENIHSTPVENGEGLVNLVVEFKQPYGQANGLNVKCRLWHNQEEVTNKSFAMPQGVNNMYSVAFVVEKKAIHPSTLDQYSVDICLCTHSTINEMLSGSNVKKLSQTKVFRCGFYPVLKESKIVALSYKENTPQDNKVNYTLKKDLFLKPLTEPLISKPFSLTQKSEHTYILEIDTSAVLQRADYDTFITLLTSNKVSMGSLFKIQDVITRIGNIALVDILYFHSGCDQAKKSADLRPGMILEVETETYMPNYLGDGDNSFVGFVSAHTAQYTISTNEKPNDNRLEFNSFINQFASTLTVTSDTDNANANGGGVLDLFINNYRYPYYKIMYPDALLSSNMQQTTYISDNVRLLGAIDYSQLQLAQQNILEKGEIDNSNSASLLMFRGRSALSLKMRVTLNNESMLVPVGTSLKGLLVQGGFYHLDSFDLRIQRLSPVGYMDIIYSSDDIDLKEEIVELLTLIHGDKIEVN